MGLATSSVFAPKFQGLSLIYSARSAKASRPALAPHPGTRNSPHRQKKNFSIAKALFVVIKVLDSWSAIKSKYVLCLPILLSVSLVYPLPPRVEKSPVYAIRLLDGKILQAQILPYLLEAP